MQKRWREDNFQSEVCDYVGGNEIHPLRGRTAVRWSLRVTEGKAATGHEE